MSIDDGFKKMLDGMRQADAGRDEILEGLAQAWDAHKDLDSQMAELRDTIATLQGMVLDLGRQIADQSRTIAEQSRTIAALRDELHGKERP